MSNNNNEQVSSVSGATATTPKNEYYQDYYAATGRKIPGAPNNIYDGVSVVPDMINDLIKNSPTHTVNPYFMLMLLNAYTSTYSAQLMTSQTRVLQYAQTLSDDWSKINTALQSLVQLGASGETDTSKYNDATEALAKAYCQLNVDLYGENISMNSKYKLTTDYPGGIQADSANYFPNEPSSDGSIVPNSCLSDFNNMMQESANNLAAFFQPGQLTYPISSNVTYSYDKPLGDMLNLYLSGTYNINTVSTYVACLSLNHADYVNGDNKSTSSPDYLGVMLDGGSVPGGETSSGIEAFTQTYLSDLMQRYSQYINQITTMINKLYDTEKQVEQSAEKEYGTYAQNTKGAS